MYCKNWKCLLFQLIVSLHHCLELFTILLLPSLVLSKTKMYSKLEINVFLQVHMFLNDAPQFHKGIHKLYQWQLSYFAHFKWENRRLYWILEQYTLYSFYLELYLTLIALECVKTHILWDGLKYQPLLKDVRVYKVDLSFLFLNNIT